MKSAKHFCSILFYTCLFLAFTSCSKYTYIQNSPNVSLFKEKGQKELQCHATIRSLQPQWAMSITDKLAYQINGNIGTLGQSYGEVLGGYYLNKGNFYLETFSGIGYGYLDYTNDVGYHYEGESETSKVMCDYIKIPLQLSVGIEDKKGSKLFITNRVSYLNYFNYNYYHESSRRLRPEFEYTIESTNSPNANGFVWDIILGVKREKFIIQIGSSISNFAILHHNLTIIKDGSYSSVRKDVYENQSLQHALIYASFGYKFSFKKKETKADS